MLDQKPPRGDKGKINAALDEIPVIASRSPAVRLRSHAAGHVADAKPDGRP